MLAGAQQSGDSVLKFALVLANEHGSLPTLLPFLQSQHAAVPGVLQVWMDSTENDAYMEMYKIAKSDLPCVVLADASGGRGTLATKVLPFPEAMDHTLGPMAGLEEEWWKRNLVECFKDTGIEKNEA